MRTQHFEEWRARSDQKTLESRGTESSSFILLIAINCSIFDYLK